jgi:hypothetical protein
MENVIIESSEIVWSKSNDRLILIIRSNGEIVGLNFMQGDELDIFKENYWKIDEDLTNFYKAVKPFFDERNNEIDDINSAIWAWFSYKNDY